ncbi:MAG: hypothetical protein WA666_03050 [Nitrospirota bacterium]
MAAPTLDCIKGSTAVTDHDLLSVQFDSLHPSRGNVVRLYRRPEIAAHKLSSHGGVWGRLSGSVTSLWTNSPHQKRLMASKCFLWNGYNPTAQCRN